MDVLEEYRMHSGKRGTKALINPNKKENWIQTSIDVGLIAMAIAYREVYYVDPSRFHSPTSTASEIDGSYTVRVSKVKMVKFGPN